jgi:hypothetical protein
VANLPICFLKSNDSKLSTAGESKFAPVDKLTAGFRPRKYEVYLPVYLISVGRRGYSTGWASGKLWFGSRAGKKFFLQCLQTGIWAHPASCVFDTEEFYTGAEAARE